MDWNATRPGEIEGGAPGQADATLTFVGRIRTPFATRAECPHAGKPDGPVCRIEVEAPWRAALRGIEAGMRLEVLYWMHLARRDLLVQAPKAHAVAASRGRHLDPGGGHARRRRPDAADLRGDGAEGARADQRADALHRS